METSYSWCFSSFTFTCPPTNGTYYVDKFPFTIEELESVLSQLKRNKTPGDDGIPGELYKRLNNQNRTLLLKAANDCLEVGHIDGQFVNAVVVSIYKKGDSSSLSSCRPISLLSCSYKIVAALVKNRPLAGLDPWLMQTQYGFPSWKIIQSSYLLSKTTPRSCWKIKVMEHFDSSRLGEGVWQGKAR